jgi:hypothetical protein
MPRRLAWAVLALILTGDATKLWFPFFNFSPSLPSVFDSLENPGEMSQVIGNVSLVCHAFGSMCLGVLTRTPGFRRRWRLRGRGIMSTQGRPFSARRRPG